MVGLGLSLGMGLGWGLGFCLEGRFDGEGEEEDLVKKDVICFC